MNKSMFISELAKQTKLTENDATLVNSVLEDHNIFGKKNKDKIVTSIKEKLNITYEEADNIYNTAINIICTKIKDKIKHPFRDKD